MASQITLSMPVTTGPVGTPFDLIFTPNAAHTGTVTFSAFGGGVSGTYVATFTGTSAAVVVTFTPTTIGSVSFTAGSSSPSVTVVSFNSLPAYTITAGAGPSIFSKFASSTIQLQPTAPVSLRDLYRGAVAALDLRPFATQAVVPNPVYEYAVAATTGLGIRHGNSVVTVFTPQEYSASAATALRVSGGSLGTEPPQDRAVSAASSLFLRPSLYRLGDLDVFASSSIRVSPSAGKNAVLNSGAATSIVLTPAASKFIAGATVRPVSASSAFRLRDRADRSALRTYQVAASSSFGLSAATGGGGPRTYRVSAQGAIRLSAYSGIGAARIYAVRASGTVNLAGSGGIMVGYVVSAGTTIVLGGAASEVAEFGRGGSGTFRLSGSALSARDLNVSATTAMGLAELDGTNDRFDSGSHTGIILVSSSGSSVSRFGVSSSIRLTGVASASVLLVGGESVPGGDSNSGLRRVAYAPVSGRYPMSFAEAQGGLVLIADGVDPMLRWDGLSGLAEPAGLAPPDAAIALGGAGVGTIVGRRYALSRFIDRLGNASAVSPLSNPVDLGRDAQIEGIDCHPTTGKVTITSADHGLLTGEAIVVSGVVGVPVGGEYDVTVVSKDRFTLDGVSAQGRYARGGIWTWGVKVVAYQNVPRPSDPKVVRRQILRNLDGSDVFFVDVDTSDLAATTLTSTLSDEELSAREAVPLRTADDIPYASRNMPPPSHKSVLCSHMGRVFAAADVTVDLGNVAPTIGSRVVRGIGTEWGGTLAGRILYISGARRSYEIATVDATAQTLTLSEEYADAATPYATYAIRPAIGERGLVYYCEAALPESWPPWNAFAVPEDDDDITGLMSRGDFLYVLKKRHTYRFIQQSDPKDGRAYLAVDRGCVNGRCWVSVDATTFMLDEAGIHAFDGDRKADPISQPIQNIFQSDGGLPGLAIDWSADRTLWHAAHDPARDTIRWFVQMRGTAGIFHAICLDYRKMRWWFEGYPSRITSSTTGTVGYRRSLVGSDARRVLVLGEGTLDVVGDASGVSGTVTSWDAHSLTDSSAPFPANLAGAPVSISSGTGRGQQRIVCDSTSDTLTVTEPWDVEPDATSTYQVGGVDWSWRSGWFRMTVEDETSNPRDLSLSYQPTEGDSAIEAEVYFDHAESPQTWGYSVNQDGVSVLPGGDSITFSTARRDYRSGWSKQEIAGHSDVRGYGPQFVSVRLSGTQGPESIRIYQVDIDGASPGDS